MTPSAGAKARHVNGLRAALGLRCTPSVSVVTIQSATLVGVEAHRIDVEVSILSSLPGLKMVGLPDATLREGRERVLLALKNAALLEARPSAVVNLAPRGHAQERGGFELPMALGILVGKERVPRDAVDGLVVVGELSLHGDVRAGARRRSPWPRSRGASGARGVVAPAPTRARRGWSRGSRSTVSRSFRERSSGFAARAPSRRSSRRGAEAVRRRAVPDFADVHGQIEARRAAEVAAAGRPQPAPGRSAGIGQDDDRAAPPGILPPLGADDALEATRVASACGAPPAGARACVTETTVPRAASLHLRRPGSSAATSRRDRER